jgi:hypothetical protein
MAAVRLGQRGSGFGERLGWRRRRRHVVVLLATGSLDMEFILRNYV